MKKKFNVTGLCVPDKHYMVDLGRRIEEIYELVDDGAYFTINRARQYGKTTVLNALGKALADQYLVINMDFQAMGNESFKDENSFSLAFSILFLRKAQPLCNIEGSMIIEELKKIVKKQDRNFKLINLFGYLIEFCKISDKPVVLMIDEADSAADNQVFLDFLAQLRNYYNEREIAGTTAFQSVILVGVYDIKNLKRKMHPDENEKLNSPWNIATDFDIKLSFCKDEIARMLSDYEADYNTGMDIEKMSCLIYDYTSGYPFLVSKFCKLIDEKVSKIDNFGSKTAAWTKMGFLQAERILLIEKNTLFDSLVNKLTDYKELGKILYMLLFTGKNIAFNPDNQIINIASMFGFIKNQDNIVTVANRVFETRLYNFYLSTTEMHNSDIYAASLQDKNQFITGGHLNMRLVLEKFVIHFNDLFANSKNNFIEDEGRKYFLLYLRPIINGTGNYYIESRTRSMGRTDVIVDYGGEQYIIEMKIWHGEEYKNKGEKQLVSYLEDYHVNKGYLVSFNFNKNKQIGVHEIIIEDKIIIEAVV